MPLLEVTNLLPPARLPVPSGQPLLRAIQAAGLDWAWTCGGKGRCTSCRLRLTAGAEWLEPLTGPEEKFRALGRLPAADRLTCQAACRADTPPEVLIQGTVPREGRLPHLAYQME